MKEGDIVQTISIYRDEQCAQLIGSGFVGEYTQIDGNTPTVNQEYRTLTVDGKSVRFAQLWSFYRSTVADGDVTEIELPIDLESTSSTTKDVDIYFTPRSRVTFNSEKRNDARYLFPVTFQIKINNTWTSCTTPNTPYIRNYSTTKPYKLIFRTGNSARYNGNIPIDATDFFGIDIISYDQQGREEPYRGAIVISPLQSFIIAGDTKPYKPKTGNSRKGGTGQGYYPNNRIPSLPTNAINAAFSSVLGRGNGLTYYKLTAGSLSEITEFLYDCSLSLKFRNSKYRDAIASCVFIPYNVPVQVRNTLGLVYLANKSIPVSGGCDIITEPLVEIDFGTISLVGDQIGFKSFADYVYTTATLYLPCFGSVNIDMHTLANGMLYLRAVIDCRNGNILYRVETRGDLDDYPVLYGQYNGNCGIPVPIGGANNGISLLGAASAIGNVGVGLATGNPLNIVGGVNSFATQTAPTIDTSGALQPAGAALGTPVPVLQIRKKVLLQPPKWDEIVGRPTGGANADDKYTLEDFAGGFVRVAWCDVSGILNATDGEKLEIERLLKEGVWM